MIAITDELDPIWSLWMSISFFLWSKTVESLKEVAIPSLLTVTRCQPDYTDGGPQFQHVPAQLHHLRGLPAAGQVQVQSGSLHVRGARAGHNFQGVHAGRSPYQEYKLNTKLAFS